MKSLPRILFALLPCYCFLSLNGQPYLDKTSAWHEFFHYPNGSGSNYEDYTITIRRDTLINGISYFKTWKSGITTVYSGGNQYMYPIDKSWWPIREEEKRFFLFDTVSNHENLMYDFNLTIGDTLNLPQDCDGRVISWADTVYIGNVPRLRYHLNGTNDIVQVIEGVGSTFGLFWSPCVHIISVPSELQCFSQDGGYLQLIPGIDCSAFVVPTRDIESDLFAISPNPFRDHMEIRLPSGFAKPITIAVFDLMGNKIHNTTLALPSSVENIDMSDAPPGMYIVCLQEAGSISSFKVLHL